MYKTVEHTLFIGKNVVFVPECSSTNDLANKLAQSSKGEGTVVITNRQTAGRGQRGNSWQAAPEQNLTFSIIIRPIFLAIKDQFFLTVITALGVHDYLKNKALEKVQIKWPNDILVNDRKICGILLENQVQGTLITTSIIGIGLNILQEDFGVLNATSLKKETGSIFSLPDELSQLLSFIESRYLQLRQGKCSDLLQDYLQVLYRRNQLATYRSNDALFTGVITGVDEIGKLQIKIEEEVRTFDLKDIQYV